MTMEKNNTNNIYDFEDDGSNLFVDGNEPAEENDVEGEEQPVNAEPTAGEEASAPPEDNAEDGPAEGEGAAQPQAIRVKVKGREVDVPIADALNPELVRKGMAFDDVYAELEQLRDLRSQTDNSLRELDKWAQQAGMSRAEYVQYLQTTRRNQAVSQEIASIREKYPDIPEEAAKEMAEARIKDSDAEEQRAAQERRQTEEAAAQEPWIDFVRRYPDMSQVEKIPAEVLAEIENGVRPVEAMQRYETKELQKQIADLNTKIGQLEQNKKNKDTALPAAGNSRDDKAEDPFLVGLGL